MKEKIKQVFLDIWKIFIIFTGIIREDNNSISSIRFMMIWSVVLVSKLIYWWMGLIEQELAKSDPNVDILKDVLKDLIYPIIALVVTGIIGKVIQKKLESKYKSNDT